MIQIHEDEHAAMVRLVAAATSLIAAYFETEDEDFQLNIDELSSAIVDYEGVARPASPAAHPPAHPPEIISPAPAKTLDTTNGV